MQLKKPYEVVPGIWTSELKDGQELRRLLPNREEVTHTPIMQLIDGEVRLSNGDCFPLAGGMVERYRRAPTS